jgi:hypothetical protein
VTHYFGSTTAHGSLESQHSLGRRDDESICAIDAIEFPRQ